MEINIYWIFIIINLIICIKCAQDDQYPFITQHVHYLSSTDKVAKYSVRTSLIGSDPTFICLTKSLDQFRILIYNINTTKSYTTLFKESFKHIVGFDDEVYGYNSMYQITISNELPQDLNEMAFLFYEEFPVTNGYLSDNEVMSIHVEDSDSFHYLYHTPYNPNQSINYVYFEFSTYDESSLCDIHVGTEGYPISFDPSSYIRGDEYVHKVTYNITRENGGLCNDVVCVYYFTLLPHSLKSMYLLANVSYNYESIKINETYKNFTINPFSSLYTDIYLPKSDEPYYHLIINVYYEENRLFDVIDEIGLFVSTNKVINPTSSSWTCLTNNSYCTIVISYNDPLFCMDCTYYIRGDGVPDNSFILKVSLNATTSNTFLPFQINPGRYFGGFIRGINKTLEKDYLFYIPPSTAESTIDSIEIVLQYDTFVESEPIGLLTNYHDLYPNPSCIDQVMWILRFDSNGYCRYYITSDSNGFCTDANFILTLRSSTDKLLYYQIWYYYNEGLLLLKNNITKYDTINRNTLGNYYLYNASSFELDTNYEIVVYNKGNYDIYVHIATTSFRDGDDSYEWEFKVVKKSLIRFIIDNTDSKYVYLKPIYLHINHIDANIQENIDIEITMKYQEPEVINLNTLLEPTKFNYTYNRSGYRYFIMDVTHVRNLKEIIFQMNSTYSQINQFFVNVNDFPKPVAKKYLFKSTVSSKHTFTLTESQKEFCTGCKYYFSFSTTKKVTHEFSVFSRKVVEPVELKVDTSYHDLIEGNSYSDIYVFSIVKNPNNPQIHFYFGKQIDTPNLEVAITTKNTNEPNCKSIYSWCYQTYLNYNNTIILNNSNPDYCTGCTYHVSVYPINIINKDVNYEINLKCPDGGCTQCPTHFDPSTSCTECFIGYYGSNCEGTCSCGHGRCNEGKHGDGSCACNDGWMGSKCNECKSNYFGPSCQQCEVDCRNGGHCEDGVQGSGECICNGNYSSVSMCSDCTYGYYGNTCQSMCPGIDKAMICSNHGGCWSGINGNGTCNCNDGYHGIDCSTNDNTTNCKPFCNKQNGYCDEPNQMCHCFGEYFGPTCDDLPSHSTGMKGSTIAIIVVVVVIVVAIIVIGGVVWFLRFRNKRSPATYRGVL